MASGTPASVAHESKKRMRTAPAAGDDHLQSPNDQGVHWSASAAYRKTITPSRLLPGPIDPHDHGHAVIYRYPLGRPNDLTTAIPRENVLQFFYPRSLTVGGARIKEHELTLRKMRRDVFLLAFAAVQSLPSSDKWSFYQIAGIHGLPHVPYDDATGGWHPTQGSKWWGGYCQHGSPLFPTWHRPYVMLLEQSIIRQAKLLGESGASEPAEAKAILDIADSLRFPFWDWANHTSRVLGMPDIFTVTEIALAYPWKSFRHMIPNPLKSYVLPENVGTPLASSDAFNPTAKPNYQVPAEGMPFTPLGYPTVRHVTPAYTTNNDQLNLAFLREAETVLAEGVHAMFHHSDWLSFSSHYWSGTAKAEKLDDYGHYSSIELVHDNVHKIIGGPGGQMAYPEIAGFDPIFFFHHCNVDRLIALWQYCYPSVWIPGVQEDLEGTFTLKPESLVDAATDLTPFRRSGDTHVDSFVSSNDVRIIDQDCGYTYPEILLARQKNWAPSVMLHHCLCNLYRRPHNFTHRWFLKAERIVKGAFNGPSTIRVFIDMPDADAKTPTASPHYAGEFYAFARQSSNSAARCANCEQRPFMRNTIELTRTMLRLGITTAPGYRQDDADGSVQPPARNPLEDAIKLVYVNTKGDPLPEPSTLPKLSVVYQESVPEEEVFEFLRATASRSTADVLRQNHALPKGLVQHFPIND